MYKIKKDDDSVLSFNSDAELIAFAEKRVKDDGTENYSILGIGDAIEYIEDNCDDLTLIEGNYIDYLLDEDHQTIVDKVGNYLEFIGETDQKDDFLNIAWDENNIPVSITKNMLTIVIDDMEDFEDYIGTTTL